MPIYEYEPLEPCKTCEKCAGRFEIIQGIEEEPLSSCLNADSRFERSYRGAVQR